MRETALPFFILALLISLTTLVRAGDSYDMMDPPTATELMENHYEVYRDISLDIMKQCPPSKCVYLGLGQSPTPVMSVLQNFSPGNAFNMPLSLKGSMDWTGAIPGKHKSKLPALFDRFVPDVKSLEGKELVIIDYVSSGDSLLVTQQQLDDYLFSKGFRGKVSVYAITNTPRIAKNVAEKAKLRKMPFYSFSNAGEKKFDKAFSAFTIQSFDGYSEYGGYKLAYDDLPEKKPDRDFLKLREQANAKALADANPDVVKLQPTLTSVEWSKPAAAPVKKAAEAKPVVYSVNRWTPVSEIIETYYDNYRDVALDIMKQCPPSKCRYIGLGRSPTPISALLESLSPGSVTNLPLALQSVPGKKVPEAMKKELFAHFDNFLPDLSTYKGKEIVLVDFVSSGHSLVEGQQLLEEYAKSKGYTGKISVYAFGHRTSVKQAAEFATEKGVHFYGFKIPEETKPKFNAAFEAFTQQKFDTYAEYGTYKIGKSEPPVKQTSASYDELRLNYNGKILFDESPEMAPYKVTSAEAPIHWKVHSPDNPSSSNSKAVFLKIEEVVCKAAK